jgi:beta-glucosidase
MDAGIKVMGYIYWSLIDNFEWDKGFAPRFGLIEVEYPSLRRTIRDSAKKFASVILEGGIK